MFPNDLFSVFKGKPTTKDDKSSSKDTHPLDMDLTQEPLPKKKIQLDNGKNMYSTE
jgi:hypothetical protein